MIKGKVHKDKFYKLNIIPKAVPSISSLITLETQLNNIHKILLDNAKRPSPKITGK